jgi:phage portal protein BeeE
VTIGDTVLGLLGWPRRSLESGTPGIEGQPKQGPWLLTTGQQQGWLPAEWGYHNFWQMDLDPIAAAGGSAIVEACVAAYAQTIAMCPGDHWRALPDGGRERVTTSALSRILRRPNDYQSRSDFMLRLAADLYRDGNTYALAQRNDRFEVTALHPFDPRQSRPIVSDSGEIFYELAGNNVIEPGRRNGNDARLFGLPTSGPGIIVPARDVFHVKLEACRAEPLVGVPPSRHAASAIAAQQAIGNQLVQTFGNMNRPAGVIETDNAVQQSQIDGLRKSFNDAWRGINNLGSGPPILSSGFKFKGIAMTAKDADVAGSIKLTQEEIWMVYGVPPAVLGMTDKSSFASTEALMQFWLARGLGFALNHIETAFDHFFGLKSWPDEYMAFDESALLRVAYKDRLDALAKGVQGGIYAPNEARRFEELPPAPSGDEPRVQQQVVPLSAWDKAPPSTPRPNAPPAAPPAAGADGEDDEARDWTALTLRKLSDEQQAA